MPRNIYNPNESREDRRQQNERVKHLLDEWMAALAWNYDANAIEACLDSDVILAAQAKQGGVTVVTTNRKHLSRFVPTIEWTEIPAST